MSWRRALDSMLGRQPVIIRDDPIDDESTTGPVSAVFPKRDRALEAPAFDRPAMPAELERQEALYAQQRESLEQRFAEQGITVFVAAYMLAWLPESLPFSYSVWTQHVAMLLPETDVVVLVGVSCRTRKSYEIFVRWRDLIDVAGERCLVQEPALIPARWRTITWPDHAMLAELRAAAVPV